MMEVYWILKTFLPERERVDDLLCRNNLSNLMKEFVSSLEPRQSFLLQVEFLDS